MTDIREAVARAYAPIAWAALGAGDTRRHMERRATSLRHADDAFRAIEMAGFAVVPREATTEMLDAAGSAFLDATQAHVPGDLPEVNRPFRRFYRAMLAAAPPLTETKP